MAVCAPELDIPGITWLNAPAPLSLAALRGRLAVLDFWTLCCINCLHVLPTLARLEAAFPDDIAVIGVHSPKFPHERDPEAVRAALLRHRVRHPVAHDPGLLLWRQYAIRAWPTLVFIDPDGYVLGQSAGEPAPDKLVEVIGRMVDKARALGVLRPAPLPAAPAPEAPTRFRFPAKIRPVPGERGARWVLADAGHHQVVLLDDGGGEVARFGDGRPGFADGPAGEARFRDPQGVAADETALWVADTGNHAIRRIDLATGAVATVAGTGVRGRKLGDTAPALQTALASPWDLVPFGGGLLFANAGTHQLGALDPAAGEVERLAGSGVEDLRDGPAAEAALAQPSGLALADGLLLFADSESSAVRALDLERMEVTTLVGEGLFSFGHVNGDFAAARLQHPLGVAPLPDGAVLVADSYNGVLRVLDPATRTARDLDDGYACRDPVCLPPGGEPAGAWPDPHAPRILSVETNRHRIVEILPRERAYRTWSD